MCLDDALYWNLAIREQQSDGRVQWKWARIQRVNDDGTVVVEIGPFMKTRAVGNIEGQPDETKTVRLDLALFCSGSEKVR